MRSKLVLILILTILLASISVGCGGGSPCPSTLTILSITEGEVFVMKEGTADWLDAEVQMELEVGDSVKTGENSGAEITFFDGSTMELLAGTQIEILSLDIVCSTGVTTISLLQTIGDTISHVTEILDPASSYEVETPGGVAGVRGSGLRVRVVYGHPEYPDGTALVTNLEGNIYAIAQGVLVEVPVGQTCIITPGEPPELITFAQINVVIVEGPTASIFISDNTTGGWAMDKDTGNPVNGENHETSDTITITVAGGRYYYVWVEGNDYIFQVYSCPGDWDIIHDYPYYDAEAAYGLAATDSFISVSFY
jgi:hypothetical protein